MIITLEHEDIETALLSWMNEKGLSASADTTSIMWTKGRKTGRMTAVIDPNGKEDPADARPSTQSVTDEMEGKVDAPDKKLFNT